ncbi:hypothetical protein BG000_005357, partial [Podila horticola]
VSPSFRIKRGPRQGDPGASSLFNFALGPFPFWYNKNATGIPNPGPTFKIGAFAEYTNFEMGEGDGAIALHAIDLHQHASGALINVDKSVIIPLNSSAVPAEFLTLPFPWKAYGEPFVHLEVDNASGGRDMATIETEFLRKLQRQ